MKDILEYIFKNKIKFSKQFF